MFEGYDRVWGKVSNLMKKELDSEPLYNGIIYKLKFYDGKIKRNFHDEFPKEPSHCLIDFVFKMSKNYYPKVFMLQKKIR